MIDDKKKHDDQQKHDDTEQPPEATDSGLDQPQTDQQTPAETDQQTPAETTPSPPENGTQTVDPEAPHGDPGDETALPEGDTFSREYVQELRQESANYRTQLRAVQEQLHRLQVENTGQLADPADLPFDPAYLDDPDALMAAIEALLEQKPHLKARRFDPGAAAQGPRHTSGAEVNLADLMRGHL